jgi:hypothetical protein
MNAPSTHTRFPEQQQPTIQVSVGELFDKKTILEIKVQKLANPSQRANVMAELAVLAEPCAALSNQSRDPHALAKLVADLLGINSLLWDLENKVRQLSREGRFGQEFVAASQQIFHNNDERARTKRAIN